MKTRQLIYAIVSLFLPLTTLGQSTLKYVPLVNPLVGTKNMGHTYPGATVPFGAIQLSPDTDTIPYSSNGKYNPDVYKYCAGYQYDDPTIVGFSHTHFSGTGHSDLGDILVMPTSGKVQLIPGTSSNPKGGFRSAYRHANEIAQPNYYSVLLDDDGIEAELTSTTRVGMHRYRYSRLDSANIVLDMMSGIYNYPDKNIWTFIRVENDTLITGYRQTSGWAKTRCVYFAISFSRSIKHYGYKNFSEVAYRGFYRKFNQEQDFPEMAGRQIRAYFSFDLSDSKELMMKVAISPVSMDGAIANMKVETPSWDFDGVKLAGQRMWEKELSRVEVTSHDSIVLKNFYTSMYHAFINPTVYMDVDGKYRGLDQRVHEANGFTNYTTFSLWDTHRALHPLFNLICPSRNRDMVKSMLAHASQSVHGMLPVWSHYGNENWCMTGYHAVSAIADAKAKGVDGIDYEKALDACIQTSNVDYFDGIKFYKEFGYVPEDKSGSSASKTLEYAYDDWCIAQLAKALNRQSVYEVYSKRALSYRNVFDSTIGFMRPRLSNGSFKSKFDVLSTHDQGFIEGNAWNYSLYVPHNPKGLIQLMGGDKRFISHLDSLFTMDLPDHYFAETEDITRDGLIGNYVHGNEPSHHVAYLYCYTSKPWKTQERVRMIMEKMYKPYVDGLSGNDDCGQMSAWYIFSALGFYPVAPGADEYALGSPAVESALVKLENGHILSIIAKNQGSRNVYVKKITLNGKPVVGSTISHSALVNGGVLEFEMSSKH